MSNKIYLPVVTDVDLDKSTVLTCTALPFAKGGDDENLACGKCKGVIMRNVSSRTFYERFGSDGPMIFHCPCGAYVKLPGRIV